MNTMTPAPAAGRSVLMAPTGSAREDEMMTRREVAYLFRVTSAAVATWARRGRLAEVRNEAGQPRYRRSDVEALLEAGIRRGRRP